MATKLDDFSSKVMGPENYIEPLIKTIEDYKTEQKVITDAMGKIKTNIKKQRDDMLKTFMTKEIIESNEDFKAANPNYVTLTDADKTAARTTWINSLSSEQKNRLIARYSPDMPEKYEKMSKELKNLKKDKENAKVALKSKAEAAIQTYETLAKTNSETLKSIDAEIKEINNKINNMNIELAKLNRVETNPKGNMTVNTTESVKSIKESIGKLENQRDKLQEKYDQLSSITEALNMEVEQLKNDLADALSKDGIFVGHYTGAGNSEQQTPSEQTPQSVRSNYGSVDTSDLTPGQKAKNMAEEFCGDKTEIEISQMVDKYGYGDLQAMIRNTEKGIKGWATRSDIQGTLENNIDRLCGRRADHKSFKGLEISMKMLQKLGYNTNDLQAMGITSQVLDEDGIPTGYYEVYSNTELKELKKLSDKKFILLDEIMQKMNDDYLTMNDTERVEADRIMRYLKLATLNAEAKMSPLRRGFANIFNTRNKKIFGFGKQFRLFADERGKRARRDASRKKFLDQLTDTTPTEYEMDDITSLDRGYTNGIDARDGMWDDIDM